jgi:hypothetical protein
VLIKSQKDFFSGLMFTAVGAAFAYGATGYSVGTGGRMGPGYFPLLLGVILALLGGIIMFKALVSKAHPDGDKIGKWAWKPLLLIISANLLFGVMLGGLPSIGLPPMGLIAGIFALTIVASLAGDRFNLKEVLVLSVILSIGSYAAFILLLKLQFPVWPTFIAG